MVLEERSIEKKKVKFARFVLAPVKVLLCGARDFYINAFCACGGRIGEGSVVMTGFAILPQVYPMRGSSSSTSTKEKRSIESSKERTIVKTTTNAKENISETNGGGREKFSAALESGRCLRSYSIGLGQIGRIDEDGPCDFVETNASNKSMMYQGAKAVHFSNKDLSNQEIEISLEEKM